MDTSTPSLPEEIITNILKRLPAKSLVRFQCVCKHWKNLFKTPSFITDHLHCSNHQNPCLLFKSNKIGGPFHLSLLNCQMQVSEVQNPPLINSLSLASIIGSSNGLLCVEFCQCAYLSPLSFLLWNPATREVKLVPRTIDDFEGICPSGFGFSPIINDHKIVRVYCPIFYDYLHEAGDAIRVEVYSLSTGSWKDVEFGNLEGVKFKSPYAITANGAMFWRGFKHDANEDENHGLIVSFDMAMEVFALIPMPSLASNALLDLSVYENKPAIISITSHVDLWVMEQGIGASWERWTWTKKYTGPYLGMRFPSFIWRNEFVWNDENSIHVSETSCEANNGAIAVLSLLNMDTNELKKVKFAIHRWGNYHTVIFNYVESLVPVGNKGVAIRESDGRA